MSGAIVNLNIQDGLNKKVNLKIQRIIIVVFALLVVCSTSAQTKVVPTSAPAEEGTTFVYLENSETLKFDERRMPDAQVLVGDVIFRHDSVLMYCDSAYFYDKKNSLDAFGNVRILQGDSLSILGDVLYYDGNTRLARLRNNVLLENKGTTLTTDSLNYDRNLNIAYYFTKGVIKDSLNTLSSVQGTYFSDTDVAFFKYDVELENEKFMLYADSLKYNTRTKIADLIDTTLIIYQEETTILANAGWYNTESEKSLLLDRSTIINDGGKTMRGDSMFYNKPIQQAEIFGGMELTDSLQKSTLYGGYGKYDEIRENGYATLEPVFVDWSSTDSLFLHADSLFLSKDSVFNKIRAYNTVRVYSEDAQMVCDSLVYSERDSIMNLYENPIMWNGNMQVSGDFVQVYMNDSTVEKAHFIGKGLVVRQIDTLRYDQLTGKEITAYMNNGELSQVDVDGNAETVFYPMEEDGTLLGVNKTVSSFIKMYFKDRTIERAVFTSETTGTMYPLFQLSQDETRLGLFFWAENERPQSKEDIFANPTPTPRGELTAKSAVAPANKDDKLGNNKPNNRENSSKTGSNNLNSGSFPTPSGNNNRSITNRGLKPTLR